MTDTQPAALTPHPFHTLVSWPAIIAGALVAVTVGAMLNLLGVAIGAAALNPFDLSRGEAEGFGAGAGVWVALVNAVALFIGGAVASRAAKFPDHHRGLLNGLAVWAVAFVIAILVAGSTAAGGFVSTVGGVAERMDPVDVASAPYYDRDLAGPMDPALPDSAPAVPVPAQPAVDDATDATGAVALWAFLTMLAGGVAAILGARYGGRRHGWETKAGVTDGGSIHSPATATTTATTFRS
ncbi:MAG: YrzE family protein [Caulobacter sp.]|nr:YrzE family protein [Caulobacter sp.]